jgi:hypothetical protein
MMSFEGRAVWSSSLHVAPSPAHGRGTRTGGGFRDGDSNNRSTSNNSRQQRSRVLMSGRGGSRGGEWDQASLASEYVWIRLNEKTGEARVTPVRKRFVFQPMLTMRKAGGNGGNGGNGGSGCSPCSACSGSNASASALPPPHANRQLQHLRYQHAHVEELVGAMPAHADGSSSGAPATASSGAPGAGVQRALAAGVIIPADVASEMRRRGGTIPVRGRGSLQSVFRKLVGKAKKRTPAQARCGEQLVQAVRECCSVVLDSDPALYQLKPQYSAGF